MLTILEQKDLSAYQDLIKTLPDKSELHLSEAHDGEKVKGWILYTYETDQVVIYDVNDGGDWNYCDGLVRSVLFKAELRGIERALFCVDSETMLQRLRTLHFVNNDENILESIADIMNGCQKCKEKSANT